MAADQPETEVIIECVPNGPFIVKNLSTLRNSKNESIPAEKVMALCRCGASANKPFCDGSHVGTGFSGSEFGPMRWTSRVGRSFCSRALPMTSEES